MCSQIIGFILHIGFNKGTPTSGGQLAEGCTGTSTPIIETIRTNLEPAGAEETVPSSRDLK